MNTFIENQNWRYATKKFEPSKKISDADFEILKEAIRLSTSSYGLQPYKVLIIENPEIREKLRPVSWNQSQVTEASHLIVFANETNLGSVEIDAFIENTSEIRQIPLENLTGYANFMKAKIGELTDSERSNWTAKQAYLALGNLINAAAELKIDVTPMEGFDPEIYNEILNLKPQNLNATLVAAVGYRDPEDATQFYKKVRKPNNELFITI